MAKAQATHFTFQTQKQSVRRRRLHLLLFGILTLLLLAGSWYLAANWTALLLDGPMEHIFLVVGLAVLLLGSCLGSLHSWALTQIDVLHRKVRKDRQVLAEAGSDEKKRDLALQRLGNRECGYCGEDHAPLVCSKCDSLQWSDISWRQLTDGTDPEPLDPSICSRFFGLAAFICHHRFKLLASVWTLIAVVFIPLAFQVAYERALSSANEHAAQTERAREVINAISEFRASLDQFELACKSRQGSLSSECNDLLKGFKRNFLFVSWNAGPVVDYFQRTECSRVNPVDPGKIRTVIDANKRSEVGLLALACRVAELHDPVDYLDVTYRSFVRQVLVREEATPEEQRAANQDRSDPHPSLKVQKRQEEEEAALVWRAGLELGCLTFGLAHGSRFTNYPREKLHAFGSCVEPLYALGTELEFLRLSKEKEPELFPCRQRSENRFQNDYWYSRGLRWAAETDRSRKLGERRLACNESYLGSPPDAVQRLAKDL